MALHQEAGSVPVTRIRDRARGWLFLKRVPESKQSFHVLQPLHFFCPSLSSRDTAYDTSTQCIPKNLTEVRRDIRELSRYLVHARLLAESLLERLAAACRTRRHENPGKNPRRQLRRCACTAPTRGSKQSIENSAHRWTNQPRCLPSPDPSLYHTWVWAEA